MNSLQRGMVEAIRWYVRSGPLRRGQTRLMSWGRRFLPHHAEVLRSLDGRRFALGFPRDHGLEQLYFAGVFEAGTTRVVRRLLREDDVTFDVGANVGWYTTLFGLQAPRGHCHAFEPQPSVFDELATNCRLNGVGANVTLNNVGVVDREDSATIYHFGDLTHGHSSLSPVLGRPAEATACKITSIDEYRRAHSIERIDFVKVDVEGAELLVLKGAQSVFGLKPSPMWLLEMNYDTSRAFGYTPVNLPQFLAEQDDFRFLRIAGASGALRSMSGIEDWAHGDNVLCIPPGQRSRLS